MIKALKLCIRLVSFGLLAICGEVYGQQNFNGQSLLIGVDLKVDPIINKGQRNSIEGGTDKGSYHLNYSLGINSEIYLKYRERRIRLEYDHTNFGYKFRPQDGVDYLDTAGLVFDLSNPNNNFIVKTHEIKCLWVEQYGKNSNPTGIYYTYGFGAMLGKVDYSKTHFDGAPTSRFMTNTKRTFFDLLIYGSYGYREPLLNNLLLDLSLNGRLGVIETILVSNRISSFNSPQNASTSFFGSTLVSDFLNNIIKIDVGVQYAF